MDSLSSNPKTEPALSDNDILMLLQAASLNAGSKMATIHTKQLLEALKELYLHRQNSKNKVEFANTNQVHWVLNVDNNSSCPTCGHMMNSIPRLGIHHICATFNCPSCNKLHWESKEFPGICVWCAYQKKNQYQI